MARYGRKSNAPGGYGTIDAKGYRRVFVQSLGRQVLEHLVVWEAANGPVPDGYQLHHRNGDKIDNRLENLQLVTPLEHKRLHSGCIIRNGQWFKPCRKCNKMKPIVAYRRRSDGLTEMCKECWSATVIMRRYAKKNPSMVLGKKEA